MKKNKNEKQTGEFKSSPFKALKGFSTKPAASTTAAAPKTKTIPMREEDEAALFLRTVGGVKRLAGIAAPKTRTPTHVAPQPDTPRENHEQELFLEAMSKIGTAAFRDAIPKIQEDTDLKRSQSSRMRQLKRGTLRITGEIDLHGQFKDEALASLERFITTAYARGQQAVLNCP